MDLSIQTLPAINATLNALAGILLVIGLVLIKARREQAHKWTMLAAFAVSSVFLACYLAYHYTLRSRYGISGVPFVGPPGVRLVYLAILISHVLLAVTVPFLAGATIYLGYRDRRLKHRQLARWTWPIWLYVSVTGVVIYAMLYHLYPGSLEQAIIQQQSAPSPPAAEVSGAETRSDTETPGKETDDERQPLERSPQ